MADEEREDLGLNIPPLSEERAREIDERMRLRQAHRICEYYRADYEDGDNPLFALMAFSTAREYGAPIPDWVLVYLDRSVKELLKIKAESGAKQKAEQRVGSQIATAMRLGGLGQGDMFTRFNKVRLKRRAALEVAYLFDETRDEYPAPKLYKIFEAVAEMLSAETGKDIAPKTIAKWHYERPLEALYKNPPF